MRHPDQAPDIEPLSGTRVLIVEDEYLIALQIEQVLADAGAEILGPAATVAVALSLARTGQPSCALLDYRLGFETAAAIADFLTEARVPFAFMTGQSQRDLQELWPGHEVLAKPSSPDSLVAVVTQMTAA